LLDTMIFSDGAGHAVVPTNDAPFPIVPGQTDMVSLLKQGPVMIGGTPGQIPPAWLLATSLAPDGRGIICDDPITGNLVELAYDPVTRTLGGITGIFDGKARNFVALANAANEIPAGVTDALSALQSFKPSTYFAVAVH